MATKIQTAFFYIMIILLNNNSLYTNQDIPSTLNSALPKPTETSAVVIPMQREKKPKLDENNEETKYGPFYYEKTKNVFEQSDAQKQIKEHYQALKERLNSISQNYCIPIGKQSLGYSFEVISNLSQPVQNYGKAMLTVSPDDRLECDKIAGVCALFVSCMTSCLKKTASTNNQQVDLAEVKNEKISYRKKIKNSFKGLCNSSKRIAFPLVAGWITYKLIATNQEVKQSICNGLACVRDNTVGEPNEIKENRK